MSASLWDRLHRLLDWFRSRTPSPVRAVDPTALPADLDKRLRALLPVLTRAGIEPDARELAEVLWLADHLDAPSSQSRQDRSSAKGPEPGAREEATRTRDEGRSREGPQPPEGEQPVQETARSKAYPRSGKGVGQRP